MNAFIDEPAGDLKAKNTKAWGGLRKHRRKSIVVDRLEMAANDKRAKSEQAGLNAHLELHTSVGGIYCDEDAYPEISVPEEPRLSLPGKKEIMIPHGEFHLTLKNKSKETLKQYSLPYELASDQTRLASEDGAIELELFPLPEGNHELLSISVMLPPAVFAAISVVADAAPVSKGPRAQLKPTADVVPKVAHGPRLDLSGTSQSGDAAKVDDSRTASGGAGAPTAPGTPASSAAQAAQAASPASSAQLPAAGQTPSATAGSAGTKAAADALASSMKAADRASASAARARSAPTEGHLENELAIAISERAEAEATA